MSEPLRNRETHSLCRQFVLFSFVSINSEILEVNIFKDFISLEKRVTQTHFL